MTTDHTSHDSTTATTGGDPRLPDGFGKAWVQALLAAFDTYADALGDLDRRSGDGDFGTNMTIAFGHVREQADERDPRTYTDWVTCVSRGFLDTGGTSGPLLGMFFRDLARATGTQDDADPTDEPTVRQLGEGFAAGLATIQRYGKAQVGHKTMVDALAPAVDAFRSAATRDDVPVQGAQDVQDVLDAAVEAARDGARSTADITAKRGRAAYVGDASKGVPDPGAVAMALVIDAARAAATGDSDPVDLAWLT